MFPAHGLPQCLWTPVCCRIAERKSHVILLESGVLHQHKSQHNDVLGVPGSSIRFTKVNSISMCRNMSFS